MQTWYTAKTVFTNFKMLHCLKCKKHTDNVCPKKLIMITNIKIKEESRCAKCLAIKS